MQIKGALIAPSSFNDGANQSHTTCVATWWILSFCCLMVTGTFVSHTLAATETAKLTANDGAAGDYFGTSVAISGDTMVVGAYTENKFQGAAYVFVRFAGTWTQRAKLIASDGTFADYFGLSVAISGDTIVVASVGDNIEPVREQGSAYVFVKPPGGWVNNTETAKLTASDAQLDDVFGRSVAVSGDVVVVGADGDDTDTMLDHGSVYVFVKPASGWTDMTQSAKLIASDAATSDLLGYAVAVSNDTIVAGAYFDNLARGSAYVFAKPVGGWADMTQTAKLSASDALSNDQFGNFVAISDDTIVVAAHYDDFFNLVSSRGSAYVFEKPDGGWGNMTQTAKLTFSNLALREAFATSVAVSGNIVIVGAPRLTNAVTSAPVSAYVFVKPDSGWSNLTPTTVFTASDGVNEDAFGYSVSVSGDTAVVGSSLDDIGPNADRGSAYAFSFMNPVNPPLAPTAPHDRAKNRYLSFVPNNGTTSMAIRVDKLTVPTASCWIGAPDASGSAPCLAAQTFRVWTEPVIHVGDCEIVPVADYEIRATTHGVLFSTPLTLSTIPVPSLNNKLWGDLVGTNNGLEWTPPNQFTNINDVLAILSYITDAAVKPTFQQANLQAISSADPCLNAVVNTADVLAAVKAVAGDPYPFTTDPAQCPVCP